MTMQFSGSALQGGPFLQGILEHCSRNGGSYKKGHGFFDVHWEVQDSSPGKVRLHVEAPPGEPDLLALKLKLIDALDAVREKAAAHFAGTPYVAKRGTKINQASRNKSTEVFHVDMGEGKLETSKLNIRSVDDGIGRLVADVLDEYSDEIEKCFPQG